MSAHVKEIGMVVVLSVLITSGCLRQNTGVRPGPHAATNAVAGDAALKTLPPVKKLDDGNPSPVKVAIYESEKTKNSWRENICAALAKDKEIQVETIDNLQCETLKKYDVLILSAILGLSEKDTGSADLGVKGVDYLNSLLNFVDSGRGVILAHDCVGYRGVFGANKIFRSICVGNGKVDGKKELSVVNRDHPVTKGAPEVFTHLYFDHIIIEPGPKAEVLVRDKENNPVIVAGELSRGRVVGIGYPMGIWTKTEGLGGDYSIQAEIMILVNSVKWAGANPKYDVPGEVTRATLLAELERTIAREREADLAKWKDLPDPHFDEAIMWLHYAFYGTFAREKSKKCMSLDSEAKIVQAIENSRKMGFTAIYAEAKGRLFNYPSKLYPAEERLPVDFVGIVEREARKREMKVGYFINAFFSCDGDWTNYPPCLTKEEAANGKSAHFWNCPDHPKVREKALKITAEIIEKYHPDFMGLDFERYSDGYATSCFCAYSMERKADFARRHPELSAQDVVKRFSEESIGGFVKEWVALCKRLDPKIKTCAYTMSGGIAPVWVYKFPVDYHKKYVSRHFTGLGWTLGDVMDSTLKYSDLIEKNNPDGQLMPLISAYDYKPPERVYAEFKVLSHAWDQLKPKKNRIFTYYS